LFRSQAVAGASTQMRKNSEQASQTSEQAIDRAAHVASASEEMSTNVQTVAVATEELSASIQEINRQMSESATVTGEAVRAAEQTSHDVQGLAEAASKIGEVVKLINDIA